MRPSFLAQGLNGILFFIAFIMFAMNYKTFNNETTIMILLLLSITIGVHGILHHFEEIYYSYNPLDKVMSSVAQLKNKM